MGRRTRGQQVVPRFGDGPRTASHRALLSRGTDRHFRQMIHSLVAYANCVLAARDGFAALLGISGVQYEILMVVYRLNDRKPCGVTETANVVGRTVPFVTLEVNKLVAKGFLDKQVDFTDRRRVLLRTTSHAVKRLHEIAPVQRRINDTLFESISAAEFRSLCSIYEKLAPCGVRAAEMSSIIVKENGRNAVKAAQR
jgi:DNA-binding MarR family transcriptional regulator